MTTWDERMGPRPEQPLPKLERLEVLWRVQAPTSSRVYECVAYGTDAGVELRFQRNEDDVLRTSCLLTEASIEMTSAPRGARRSWRRDSLKWPMSKRWNPRTLLFRVQLDYESKARERDVRLIGPKPRVGDPVRVALGGAEVEGQIVDVVGSSPRAGHEET